MALNIKVPSGNTGRLNIKVPNQGGGGGLNIGVPGQNKPAAPSRTAGLFNWLEGNLGGNYINDLRTDPNNQLKSFKDLPLIGGFATGLAHDAENIVSGKDIERVGYGTPLGSLGQKMWDTYGKKLPHQDVAAQEKEMAKNPSALDRLGAGLNIVSTPFIVKDAVVAPFKFGAKYFGKDISMGLADINKEAGGKLLDAAGKFVGDHFGKFGQDVYDHYKLAKDVLPNTSIGELKSPRGQHVIDWVEQQAQKIQNGRGHNLPVQNSDILQAWSKARQIWGDNITTMSKNMDNFARTMDRVVGGTQELFSRLGVDDSFMKDLTLYTPEYMRKARTAAKERGAGSPYLIDYLKGAKDRLINQPIAAGVKHAPDVIDNAIAAIEKVEKETGYKVGAGHMSFIFPKVLQGAHDMENIPAEIAGKSSMTGRILGKAGNLAKAMFDPQVYTNEAKQSLFESRFYQELQKQGLDPKAVMDRIGYLRNKGIDFSLHNSTRAQYKEMFDSFGKDAYKMVLKARDEAGKLPLKYTGLNTLAVAKRIPGASPLTTALFGARWGSNPLFQLVKIPTKLYELAATQGIKPWSPEASASVVHYLETEGSPMVSRLLQNEQLELQQATKWAGARKTADWVQNSIDAPKIVQFVANFMDHVANADEHVYAKAVFKSLKDQGVDLSKIPFDQQLNAMKQIPVDVLGRADNYARSITKYGQGTSPLQNTINTIFFPFLFHSKVAKYAASGALTHPAMAKAISDLVQAQNQWALSPAGQLWHRSPGFGQAVLHALGQAEPINIPAMTGHDESMSQQVGRFTHPYNPFSPVLQLAKDETGADIPGTQPASSNFEIQHPILNTAFGLTGYGSLGKTFAEQQGAVAAKSSYPPTMKSIKAEQQRASQGQLPPTKSLLASMRGLAGGHQLSSAQKKNYAEMRASYDFPDDKNKQNQEKQLIMKLFGSASMRKAQGL